MLSPFRRLEVRDQGSSEFVFCEGSLPDLQMATFLRCPYKTPFLVPHLAFITIFLQILSHQGLGLQHMNSGRGWWVGGRTEAFTP